MASPPDHTEFLLAGQKDQQRLADGWITGPRSIELGWLEIENGRRVRALRWKLGEGEKTWKWARPSLNLAWAFADLAFRSDEEILHFARQYGILGICADHAREELPCIHHMGCAPIGHFDPEEPSRFRSCWFEGAEPIKYWRRYALRVRALVEVGRSLSQGRLPRPRWLQVLWPGSPAIWADGREPSSEERSGIAKLLNAPKPQTLLLLRYRFSRRAESLHESCGIKTALDWELEKTSGVGRWIFRTRAAGPFNLVSVIAEQTRLLICVTPNRMVCDGCSREYDRRADSRLPKPGQMNYCEKCREEGVPLKAADQARRRRKRLFEELYREGRPLEDILQVVPMRLSAAQRLWKKLEQGRKAGKHGEA